MKKTVSVITLTRSRDIQLLRAIDSVNKQDYEGSIEHIVIGDNSLPLRKRERQISLRYPNVRIFHIDINKFTSQFIDCYAPSRVGFIRNVGIRQAQGEYICQLDDDNYYDKNHISSLVQSIESEPNTDITFSWRRLLWNDGSPYVEEAYPWTPEARLAFGKEALSRYIYERLIKAGIRIRGSNIVRDTLITPDGEPVYTIDTSELMVKREVHSEFLFNVNFTWREMVGDYSDDYAFVKKCHEAGLKFKCSEKITLNYIIGGHSNKSLKKMHKAIH